MNNLIINEIDHSVFDLEWAKRGGVVRHYGDFCRYICDGYNYNEIRAGQDGEFLIGVEKTLGLVSILTAEKVENSSYYLRMATPAECAEAGVEYIEPPARWLPIENAPMHTDVIRSYYDGSMSIGWIFCDGEDSAGNDVRARQPLPQPPKGE
jgi:hypothetical protein